MTRLLNKAIYIIFSISIFLIALRLHALFSEEALHRMIVKKYYLYLVSPFLLTCMVLSLLYVLNYLIFSSSKRLSARQVILLLPSIVVLLGLIFGW